ncbi:kunitz-type protease inhibitor 2 isoform X3 [Notamacropus eugenii]|uniref:kunitz-type protease inhibitor 2 isoform X3 n=1 Tax=Notamacropus eugenii TaxID=9315 RepID=UPI003B67F53F
MGQQPRHFQALLPLLGVLLLAGPAGGFDGSATRPSGAKEQAELQDLCRVPKVVENSANEAPAKRSGAHEPSPSAPPKQDSEVSPGNDFNYEEYCAAKAVTGPCRAAFPRWYFDAEKNTCAHFIFGGCRGNKNSYLTQEDCMTKCFGKRTHKSSHPVMPHSTEAMALAVLLAVMAAVLLGAMVVIFIKIARKHQTSAFNTVWNPIDDKEYLVKSAYTL